MNRVREVLEKIIWMENSPWYNVWQYLRNTGYSNDEIQQAVKLYHEEVNDE